MRRGPTKGPQFVNKRIGISGEGGGGRDVKDKKVELFHLE